MEPPKLEYRRTGFADRKVEIGALEACEGIALLRALREFNIVDADAIEVARPYDTTANTGCLAPRSSLEAFAPRALGPIVT